MKKNFVLACCALFLLCGFVSCGGSGSGSHKRMSSVFRVGENGEGGGLVEGLDVLVIDNGSKSGTEYALIGVSREDSSEVSVLSPWTAPDGSGKVTFVLSGEDVVYTPGAGIERGGESFPVTEEPGTAIVTTDGDGNITGFRFGDIGGDISEPDEPSGVFVYEVEEGLKDGCGFYLVKNKESGAAAKYMLLKEDASGNVSYCNQWATASNGKASLFVDNVKKEYDVAANTFAGKTCTEVADAVLTLDGDGNPQKFKVGEGAEKTIEAYNGMVFDKFHVEGETDMQPTAVVWDMKTDRYAAISLNNYDTRTTSDDSDTGNKDYSFSDDFYPYPMYDAKGSAFKPAEKVSSKYGYYAGSNGALVFSSKYDDTMTEAFFFIDSHEIVVFNTTGETTTVSQETACDGMTEAALEYVEDLDGILEKVTLADETVVHIAETKTVGVFEFEVEDIPGCFVRYGEEGNYSYTLCCFTEDGYFVDTNHFKMTPTEGIISDVGFSSSFNSNTGTLTIGGNDLTCVFEEATYVAPYGNDAAITNGDPPENYPDYNYDLYLNVFNDMMKIVGIDGRIISFYETTSP